MKITFYFYALFPMLQNKESKFAFSYHRTEMMNELMRPKKLAYWVYVCNNFIIPLFFDILPSSV